MRIRKLNSVDVKLHDLTKVKLKTAGNTSVVQFTTGNNKTCTVRNLSKDTYLDVKTGEVRKEKKSESRYQSPKSVRKSNNRLMDLIRCNTTDFYDGFGRLEQVTKADGSFQKNHYDAEGLRAEMEENGQLVKFLYNEDREAVAEEESDGNVIRYIRGLGLISSDSEKAKTYYHYVSDGQGSITHVINGEEKESGELPQEDVQSRVLNHYEYDAFGNTVSCEEQVHNRFRYTGEQYDPLTGQYYLRARYYNPVIARFTQEDTYYGDGLNLYTYCQNNPILYHDPTGHGTKENSPYSRKEQQYIDAGADPDTARLAAECYPDANSKKSLYDKYKKQGYNAQDAKKLANYEIVHGEERAKNYAANNVKKSGPDYTATSPRDNINTDWRTQERLNAQREAGVGKSGTNARYVDSQGNVYNNAKDYLNGPARMVNGDPLMYSMNNRNGGTVVLSTEPINGNSFINTLDYYNSQGKKVVILSGTHGSVTGESSLGANRLLLRKSKNAFCAERSFFNEDVNTANRYNNVKVYDITRMSDKKIKKLLNSKDVTICAWCYSERSNDIIKAVR